MNFSLLNLALWLLLLHDLNFLKIESSVFIDFSGRCRFLDQSGVEQLWFLSHGWLDLLLNHFAGWIIALQQRRCWEYANLGNTSDIGLCGRDLLWNLRCEIWRLWLLIFLILIIIIRDLKLFLLLLILLGYSPTIVLSAMHCLIALHHSLQGRGLIKLLRSFFSLDIWL